MEITMSMSYVKILLRTCENSDKNGLLLKSTKLCLKFTQLMWIVKKLYSGYPHRKILEMP